jgi:hypothetical protein
MTPVRRFAAGAAVTALVIGAACAPLTVTSFTGRGVDVPAYRTFAWERVDTGVPGDPRLDNNIFFHEYLRSAIDRQLVSHGYEPTILQPDVYVHYHATAQQQVSIVGEDWTTHRCRDCSVEVYDAATLLVDLTDARTGALVWRGVADSGLAGAVADQTRMEGTIERVVERIFAKLPRRS